MEKFMTKNFLLNTETARKLYFSYAATQPIIDYHCHISPKEIYEDRRFKNITEVWLEGDHYKWRLMRANGVDEYYITGNASDYEKFLKFAEALPRAIGNPMYHWCHLELKKYFGFEGALCADTAREVWELTERKLTEDGMSARGLIKQSNVVFIGTTDDPCDSLAYHKLIAADPSIDTAVAPSFRPDRAVNINKVGFAEYINRLSGISGVDISDFKSLKAALGARIAYFASNGCRASDHGLDRMVYREATDGELTEILQKALAGESVSEEETEAYKTALVFFCAKEYARLGWVMQLHYNCLRNPNTLMLERLGPDTGFDCIGPNDGTRKLASLLDALYKENALPKTVVYSLDAGDNAAIDTVIGAFQGTEAKGKLQHGSAWWFNDTKDGMEAHMRSLASLSILGNFIGMLTDSRSFLSYTRHEYFRRILCSLIGSCVENGEYPADEKMLGTLIEDISYGNAHRYFGL